MNSFGRSLFVSTLFLMAMILVLSARANAALIETEKAYELTPAQIVRWPLGSGTPIEFRPCASCDVVRLTIDDATRFSTSLKAGSPTLSLRDLLRRKSTLTSNDEAIVFVFYRTADLHVSRIVLSTD